MRINPVVNSMQSAAQILAAKKPVEKGISLTGQQISEVYHAIHSGFMNNKLPQTVAKLKETFPERLPVIESFASVFFKATK